MSGSFQPNSSGTMSYLPVAVASPLASPQCALHNSRAVAAHGTHTEASATTELPGARVRDTTSSCSAHFVGRGSRRQDARRRAGALVRRGVVW